LAPIGVKGAADGAPGRTEIGRHRKSSQGLFALRRSTTTPTGMRISAVDITGSSPR